MSRVQLPDRFVSKFINEGDGCWAWTAARTSAGYGAFRVGGRTVLAHRFAFEAAAGTIPDGLQIDHLCRNRLCVNPAHLEPVTQTENKRRGLSAQVTRERHAAKTHCPHGHPYSMENTRWYTKSGYQCRACKTCKRERRNL